jgi:hypothetical protein
MANLANLDLIFAVPCEHCAALLYGRVKFCPYCGQDEPVTFGASAARATLEPERGTLDRAETVAPIAVDAAVMPQQEVQQKIGVPVLPGALSETNEEVDFEIARFGAATFEWQKELPALITVPPPTLAPPPGAILKRLAIGRVAALVLFVLALVVGYVHFNNQSETDRSRELTAELAQAQSALSRGDLAAAERVLVVLVAAYPDHPGVQELMDELDWRMREQLAKREQLRDAALKAAKALGLGDPARSPAQAPPAAETPAIAVPPPGIGVTDPREIECNDTLAALALCPKGPVPETGRPIRPR